jgi:hypothetical protein
MTFNGIKYWDLPDSIRVKIDKDFVERKGFCYMNEELVDSVKYFFFQGDSTMLNQRYSPFYFNMQKVISDSLEQNGIFRVKISEIHTPSTFIIIDNGSFEIIKSRENYEYYKLLDFFISYIKKNNDSFSDEEKRLVWIRLAEYMEGYNFLYEPKHLDK